MARTYSSLVKGNLIKLQFQCLPNPSDVIGPIIFSQTWMSIIALNTIYTRSQDIISVQWKSEGPMKFNKSSQTLQFLIYEVHNSFGIVSFLLPTLNKRIIYTNICHLIKGIDA